MYEGGRTFPFEGKGRKKILEPDRRTWKDSLYVEMKTRLSFTKRHGLRHMRHAQPARRMDPKFFLSLPLDTNRMNSLVDEVTMWRDPGIVKFICTFRERPLRVKGDDNPFPGFTCTGKEFLSQTGRIRREACLDQSVLDLYYGLVLSYSKRIFVRRKTACPEQTCGDAR